MPRKLNHKQRRKLQRMAQRQRRGRFSDPDATVSVRIVNPHGQFTLAQPMANNRITKVQSATAKVIDPVAEFQQTLRRFKHDFGESNGVIWAAEGLTYIQALDRHCELLAAEREKLQAEVNERRAKLAAVENAIGKLN